MAQILKITLKANYMLLFYTHNLSDHFTCASRRPHSLIKHFFLCKLEVTWKTFKAFFVTKKCGRPPPQVGVYFAANVACCRSLIRSFVRLAPPDHSEAFEQLIFTLNFSIIYKFQYFFLSMLDNSTTSATNYWNLLFVHNQQ